MSQVLITFGKVALRGKVTGYPPVLSPYFATTEEFASSGTSQATTMAAADGDVAVIQNNGTDTVWVVFGATPTAIVLSTHCIMPNTEREFGPLRGGDKCAVINDS